MPDRTDADLTPLAYTEESSHNNKLIGTALALTVLSNTGVLPLTLTAAASTHAPTPAMVATAETVYIVRSGDTLSAIAKRYGVTVDALISYNSLYTTNILIGQQLLIPTQQMVPTSTLRYVVQRGDTLSALAQRYGTTVTAIMQRNNLSSSMINIGQSLLIPATLTPPSNMVERIQFAPGASAATIEGLMQDTEPRQYTLRAMAGQTMAINANTPDAGMLIEVKGVSDGIFYKRLGERFAGDAGSWQGFLPTTQDYLITIALGIRTGSRVNYTLTVSIPPQVTPQPTTQRIQFAPGADSITIYGAVDNNNYVHYLLGARRGQTMWADITGDSKIVVIAPSGQILSGTGAPAQSWSGLLPATGDYIIEVTDGGLTADYQLAVTIQ